MPPISDSQRAARIKAVQEHFHIENSQIPSDLVVKSQGTDIIGLILQLIRRPNSPHRVCRHTKSRGAVLSTAEVQWATTKFDGVWFPQQVAA